VLLDTGVRVPADCLLIESADLEVDDSPEDGEIDHIEKSVYHQVGENEDGGDYYQGHVNKKNADPFLRADSLITRGHCKAIVCCTGEKSTRGKVVVSKADDTSLTPL
jgi:magnesium-transporting ATPase (P-type)